VKDSLISLAPIATSRSINVSQLSAELSTTKVSKFASNFKNSSTDNSSKLASAISSHSLSSLNISCTTDSSILVLNKSYVFILSVYFWGCVNLICHLLDGASIESFKYCFLTSCILTRVHPTEVVCKQIYQKRWMN